MKFVPRRYSLQLIIGTLFIVLTLLIGIFLSLQNYSRLSSIIVADSKKAFAQLAGDLYLDFRNTYQPGVDLLEFLATSAIIIEKTEVQRLRHIEQLTLILRSYPVADNVQIAWPNDDYLEMRRVQPIDTGSSYVVELITTGQSGERYLTRIFFDHNLNLVSRDSVVSEFFPRTRPWYRQASSKVSVTKPYLFLESQQVGVTAMIQAKSPGVVVAMDIRLDHLKETISGFAISPSTEVLLINAEGQTFAYSDDTKLVVGTGNNGVRLANMTQLNSDVLSYLSHEIEPKEQVLEFVFDDRSWIGSTHVVARPGGIDLYALIIAPIDELTVTARQIRDQSLYIAVAIILCSIPLIWFMARQISKPLKGLVTEAVKITHFEFSESKPRHSRISEVDELDNAMLMMKSTINKFLSLIGALAAEQNLDRLINIINRETLHAAKADAAITWLTNDNEDRLVATDLHLATGERVEMPDELLYRDNQRLADLLGGDGPKQFSVSRDNAQPMSKLFDALTCNQLHCIALPLNNRSGDPIGILCLLYMDEVSRSTGQLDFVTALSGFSAVTLESRQLLKMQEALLNAFIKLIAGAIDAKSAYTGGHCQRVPEITFMLARAACTSKKPPFSDYDLDEKEWEALEIASWLHDCGKVTTPEYVVDKATKLETIYDRIHEVRMRFEVLKRDAEIEYWRKLAEGGDKNTEKQQLDQTLQQLDNDFAFVAECNLGGEFMADEKITRLQQIAQRTWLRTLDDRLGISWEAAARKAETDQAPLPVEENLLADKADHIVQHEGHEIMPDDNPWGFNLETPKHKYNRGELYNLSVEKGTLSHEERYKINDHMTQTIMMLEKLPYPKHLRDVPAIAGGHHETMDGKGYPKKLTKDQMSLTARMMAIADIFEALTASDRPYKQAKTLSESIRIMGFMRNDNHIDGDLFKLFLESGVYLEYAKKFLKPEQIDKIDVTEYLE